ncbi:unnamed protein product, partial [Symbiodinium necroappetens]
MPTQQCHANVVGASSAVSACEKQSCWEAAVLLLLSMPALRCMPNAISYNSAIASLERGSCWHIALSLVRQMFETDVDPDLTTFNAAAGSCDRSGRVSELLPLLVGQLPARALRTLRRR